MEQGGGGVGVVSHRTEHLQPSPGSPYSEGSSVAVDGAGGGGVGVVSHRTEHLQPWLTLQWRVECSCRWSKGWWSWGSQSLNRTSHRIAGQRMCLQSIERFKNYISVRINPCFILLIYFVLSCKHDVLVCKFTMTFGKLSIYGQVYRLLYASVVVPWLDTSVSLFVASGGGAVSLPVASV